MKLKMKMKEKVANDVSYGESVVSRKSFTAVCDLFLLFFVCFVPIVSVRVQHFFLFSFHHYYYCVILVITETVRYCRVVHL